MATYNLKRDVKSMIWFREYYTVEAHSYKEAISKFINQCRLVDEKGEEMEDCKDIKFDENTPMYETAEDMTPSQNQGYSTVEVVDDNCNTLYSNGK